VKTVGGVLTWRPLTAADLPLLAERLREPQVARWWNHEHSAEAVERHDQILARLLAPHAGSEVPIR